MTKVDWLLGGVIVIAAMVVMLLTGCTADLRQDVSFEGLVECRARAAGYEDLPVLVFDSETADPNYRAGFGTESTLTMTTVEGDRVTLTGASPPGYYCIQVEDA